MKVITLAEFKRLSSTNIIEAMPFLVTVDGTPLMRASAPDSVIDISDMHPAVRNQFRAHENKVRLGMPKPEKIVAEDIRNKEEI